MKLITKHTDYAIRALMHLAKRPQAVVSASEISGAENIPDKFLKRLLSVLKKEKYVLSKEGKGGGVMLARDPKKILVSGVMKLFQGEFQVSACMFRKDICPNRGACVLRKKVKAIEGELEARFAKISVHSLINDKGAGK